MSGMTEEEKLNYRLILGKYKSGNAPLKYDRDLESILYSLLCIDEKTYKPHPEYTQTSIYESKKILNKYFDFHRVYFYNDEYDGLIKNNYCTVDGYNEMVRILTDSIDPFCIPINYNEKVNTIDQFHMFDSKNIFGKNYEVNLPIRLKPLNDKIFRSVYAHEIIHTQTNKRIENYFNDEVLSIFVEYLVAYESSYDKSIFNKVYCDRLKDLKICIKSLQSNNKIANIESSKYIVSILIANSLFNLYTSSSKKVKKEILTKIQSIFDNENKLETVLKGFDISYKSSKHAIKRELSK